MSASGLAESSIMKFRPPGVTLMSTTRPSSIFHCDDHGLRATSPVKCGGKVTRPFTVSKNSSSILSVCPAGPEPANTGERSTRVADRFDSTCELAALKRESNARHTVTQVMDFLNIRSIPFEIRISADNREAVEQQSPGLPRFAATLGPLNRGAATLTGLRNT